MAFKRRTFVIRDVSRNAFYQRTRRKDGYPFPDPEWMSLKPTIPAGMKIADEEILCAKLLMHYFIDKHKATDVDFSFNPMVVVNNIPRQPLIDGELTWRKHPWPRLQSMMVELKFTTSEQQQERYGNTGKGANLYIQSSLMQQDSLCGRGEYWIVVASRRKGRSEDPPNTSKIFETSNYECFLETPWPPIVKALN